MGKSIKNTIPWNKTLLEDFISEGLLTEDEEKIIRTSIAGWSVVRQSLELGMSTSSIQRTISKLSGKYDNLCESFPNRFPKRKEPKNKN